MAATTYTYSIANDTLNGAVDSDKLKLEITASTAIIIALDNISINGDVLDVLMRNTLSGAEETELAAVVSNHDGVPLPDRSLALSPRKEQIVQASIPVGRGFRHITHNFCDKCTWWHRSSEVIDAATTTADDLTFDITGQQSLIDIRHDRLTFEDDIDDTTTTPEGITMTNIVPTVTLNNTALATTNEDATTGNDRYTLDYATGTVTFAVARAPTDVVEVSCRVAGGSHFTIMPSVDEWWVLEDAEVDVSEDIDMSTAFLAVTYGSHTILTGGNIVPVSVRKYPTFHSFQAAARKFWGPVPPNFGGAGGIPSAKWTFQWEYVRAEEFHRGANYVDQQLLVGNTDMSSITLNKIELCTEEDLPLGGSLLTLSFYGASASE